LLARLAVVTTLVLAMSATIAEEEPDEHEDEGGNFLVLPLVITEPAIGQGLGAGLVYFHATPDSRPKLATGRSLANTGQEPRPPPTATGVFGIYTNNDTRGVGVGHTHTFKEDTWRMTAALANAKINAKYYVADIPFRFSVDGTVLYGNFKRRIGSTNWFLGMSTSVADADAFFSDDGSGVPDFEFTDVGIAGMGIYDTRDDSMMPSSGTLVDLTVWGYDELLGGDFDYWTSRFKVNSFHKFGDKVVLGLRFEVGTAEGEVPFYAEPFVPLRGIPALRYQGDVAGVVEAEVRYQLASRWAVLAFAGAGDVSTDQVGVATEDDIKAWGVGFRWLALEKQNVWIGIDGARGPENDEYYVQLVHPW
jgi:hypothetical protein